ncbi:tektin-3-like [Leptopilina heterotoma]|uniref:tektin-3-like n=1 Tax=Leptopilina heterotoma TaxID=63436 RepID=UPI001CA9ACB1|nr:tektin-3-like [Leptopilina heterotoma]
MDFNKIVKKEDETVSYTQLQPWSSFLASPCMEQISGDPVPKKIGEFYKTPRPHPWRPTLGYENIELNSLPSKTMTNELVDACYSSKGILTEPLKFPNLITGFDRNSTHAAKAALYTRYTPYEWVQNQIQLYNEADSNRQYSSNLRKDTEHLIRKAKEKVEEDQKESDRKLGERIVDIGFWRNEITSELERLLDENKKMRECFQNLEEAIKNNSQPLNITQECLYQRENRIGSELVHDETEQALLKEIQTFRNCQKKLKEYIEKCKNQLKNGRASQNELEIDIKNKETALGIDTMCHKLNNYSNGLQYFGGIEKYNNNIMNAQNWAEYSENIVKKSQMERSRSSQLRTNIEGTINSVLQETWNSWSNSNNAFTRRITELIDAKCKIQNHLNKIQEEIFHIEKNIDSMKKSIIDKSLSLKVAHTRLEARTHRPQAELCEDYAYSRIVDEINTINSLVNEIHLKLQQNEAQHQQLLKTRNNLQEDLKFKTDALFIDREKCMGLRRSYPITKPFSY